jgi:hypothetical protein
MNEMSRFPIVQIIGSQMAVRLSSLRAGSPDPRGDSWDSFLLEDESTSGTHCGWKD